VTSQRFTELDRSDEYWDYILGATVITKPTTREVRAGTKAVLAALRHLVNQQGAANFARQVGVSEQGIYNWKSGKSTPKLESLVAILLGTKVNLLAAANGTPRKAK